MPLNEILAPCYVNIKYTTDAPAAHNMRLYFDELPSVTDGEFHFEDYTDAEHLTGWLLSEIVAEIFLRMVASATGVASVTINAVEVYQSVTGAPNSFMGFDASDYTEVVGGAGGVSSAYVMWFYQTSLRDKFTLTVFDSGNGDPQRQEAIPTPLVDNGFLDWFILRSAVRFTNNDGERLSLAKSYNWGVNRALAKAYGKILIP